ncbi:3-(cis-5,6-dihydroxycyclohexa-1,3-dien-1-yl)propanoate dehydrogenase [Kordiimonas pumila]|uniref:3-(Cis-5,6-dihydroxycyclohexa-1, 3-dien-1-yl)propanoate dehydrogenase n=1 Tax=Kordiimonas pumila TaxID=2161677 RepID=A0ABV7D233_9PROT|nr:3-(cis-5,6-dihydroxycyclohexa-1,3-dien-1-yl)propanoate dehydrogenase [Kordiimonas pumila]
MGCLENYVVVVTGGGTGIGLAVVDKYLTEGAQVVVLQRGQKGIDALRRSYGDSVPVVQGDVTNYRDNERVVQAALDHFGKLDVFVANAGVYDFFKPFEDMPASELEKTYNYIFDINVKGNLYGAHAAASALRASKGSLIFSASSSSFYAGGGGAVYVASKHALVGLVKQLAFELAPDVRVNAVAPGGTNTPLGGVPDSEGNTQRLDAVPGFADMVAKTVPLGFLSEPHHHTAIYTLLACREQSGFMTGAIIPSDGGLVVRGGGRRRPKNSAE